MVGQKTYGKGSVQSIIDLKGGAGLKLTTARYYTPQDRSIHKSGILPEVEVPLGAGREGGPWYRQDGQLTQGLVQLRERVDSEAQGELEDEEDK
jgi:carboxyl-terminal processing protease